MFLSLKTLYRKRTVIWPFYFYTIIRTLSKSEKSLLILLIFILSLIVIWLLFIKETSELKSEYEKLKDLYIKQLYFDKKDFSNHIKEPEIPKLYQSIFYTFLGILALRFFVCFL